MNKLYAILTGAFALLAMTAEAWAKLPDKPNIDDRAIKLDKEWMTWLAAVVLLGGAAVASFKSSKRSHLD